MSQTLTVTEVARHLAEYINRVAYCDESFMLVRGNKPIAELPALCASLPLLSATEAAQLAEDLLAAQEARARVEVHDP
jgi:antitoxin (DNA-binding transcriptional repressor) of toxin-antitoxin stability system